jgi:hypothetical protein
MTWAHCRSSAERNKSIRKQSFFIHPNVRRHFISEVELLVVAVEEGSENDHPSSFLDSLPSELVILGQLAQNGRSGGPESETVNEHSA